jgi:hypothetical protein
MQKMTKSISNWPAPTTHHLLDLTTGEARETRLRMVFEVEAADLSFERCLFSRQRCCVESISAACHVLVDSIFPLFINFSLVWDGLETTSCRPDNCTFE